MASSVLNVAVLDDYQGFSESFFATLDPASFKVTIFRDTLRPYNHPDTTDTERDALVDRLAPFQILFRPVAGLHGHSPPGESLWRARPRPPRPQRRPHHVHPLRRPPRRLGENLTQAVADERVAAAGLPVDSPYFPGEKTVRVVTKEELFREADIVSVHLVLSDRTRGVVAAEDLARMKPTAFLVNTSRGPLVKERDLLDTLKEGTIAGAAIDVFDMEPLPEDSEWRTVRWGTGGTSRVVLTPHMGYMAKETMTTWYEQQVENIKRWVAGEELNTRLV
ncbi:unnamed protein product [Parascedosporium putredinis]|uniref:D-isomer specific 2-hydroxyacid dehydrogenase NAD-binding domain-containing protein n=1 Tax=Parascedosporium putredinis TaxID=1442378 RepID=A0A9P1MFL0_9PEZI|nr:unnamed protein product [Parascedosporium putredinis]CAI8002565.1 unnamed protein product [Parascedosporium putredinis]